MRADLFHPSDLPEADAAAWLEMCQATPEFRNPLLGPAFARLVGEVRSDARVAVFRDGLKPVGFLAHHRRPTGFARPVGAAFSDYHALVTAPGCAMRAEEALATAGISAFRFTGLLDPHAVFGSSPQPSETGYLIEPGPDPAAYLAQLKGSNSKRFKNWKRLASKLEREHGALVVTPGDTSQEAFDQLMVWKRDQYRRTGVHDVYRPAWAKDLLQRTFEQREGALRGVMITLRANGKLVAGLFGPAVGDHWHGWISAFDPACCACGPGFVLMLELPQAMHALGLTSCDMAASHDHYKAPFATSQVEVAEGLAMAHTAGGRRQASLEAVWSLAGSQKVEALARLRRRLDHIAAVELSVSGRMLGVMEALVGYGRRNASRKGHEETGARDAA